MSDMTSAYLGAEQIDIISGIVFDAKSGAKKLSNFVPAINWPTSTIEALFWWQL